MTEVDMGDSQKVSFSTRPHTGFSMIVEGTCPKSMSPEEVERHVQGTFGGRFVSFGGGEFKYIAYTE